MKSTTISRFILMILGNIFIGFAVTLFRIADIGADPFTTFIFGGQFVTNLSYGVTTIVINLIIIIPLILFGRDLVSWGTFVNMFGIGLISDGFISIYHLMGIDSLSFLTQLIVASIGVIVIAFGASMYITANLGVSPYDGMGIIVERLSEKRVKYARARIIQDVIAVVAGVILGATFGVATLISAFLTGPLITFFNTRVSERLFARLEKVF
ncbi:MAG TPA: membrane protein [Aliicoccus persicus]|uniref:Membrane protein n=1 Tax=Aliicoccus persicus TaxID=930138 RepID=A0A921DYJ2_9STAP|nr:membrane protein [Aliicoccus persicus]